MAELALGVTTLFEVLAMVVLASVSRSRLIGV
jgi:hypothetical protein